MLDRKTRPRAGRRGGVAVLFVYIFVGIAVGFIVLIALAAAFERRQVWYFVPEDRAPQDKLPPANAYAQRAAGRAHDLGFRSLGVFADGKGKLYRVRYEFYRSPEGDTLAQVGTGSMASIPVEGTWLFTVLADGRCLVTLDSAAGSEIDFTGIIEEALVEDIGFEGLLRQHQARVGAAGVPVVAWTAEDPLADFHAFRTRRIERLVALGCAALYRDDPNAWHYTARGSVALALRQYFKGVRRQVVTDTQIAARQRAGR